MGGPWRDVEAGWARATAGDLGLGALVGLALSAPAIVGAALLTPLGVGAATAMAMPLQLGATYAVAGRRARRRAAG